MTNETACCEPFRLSRTEAVPRHAPKCPERFIRPAAPARADEPRRKVTVVGTNALQAAMAVPPSASPAEGEPEKLTCERCGLADGDVLTYKRHVGFPDARMHQSSETCIDLLKAEREAIDRVIPQQPRYGVTLLDRASNVVVNMQYAYQRSEAWEVMERERDVALSALSTLRGQIEQLRTLRENDLENSTRILNSSVCEDKDSKAHHVFTGEVDALTRAVRDIEYWFPAEKGRDHE